MPYVCENWLEHAGFCLWYTMASTDINWLWTSASELQQIATQAIASLLLNQILLGLLYTIFTSY